ncbi:nucleoporin NDC1 isoform X1 [Amblyraja radiata]|uniref:nucleoporin NDC1 isoform X1 n=2 Tax=Amblyraja radiata TaxID=386614 RepID=UPI0014029C01|nr:nucleoporin NDC1 isoform X1 [Amblyraja radiata]
MRVAGSEGCAERPPGLWFIRKVFSWRAAAAIAWSVLLLPVSTTVFIMLSQLNVFCPVQWISDTLNHLNSSCIMFSILVLCGSVVVIGIFNMEYYTVEPSIPCSRIALIGNVFHPHRFIHSVVHAVMGMLMAWCTAVIAGGRYQMISVPCSSRDSSASSGHMCLNEFHVFLLMEGAFIGYCYSLLYFANNFNYLSFPTMQQFKYLRFKANLSLVIKYSAVQSLYFLRNYCILYYFLGYVPRAWISASTTLQKDSTQHCLDTLAGLFDLPLLYTTWLSGTFILVTWYITWVLFKIYITEVFQFSVQSNFGEEADQCLPKVLTTNVSRCIKYLALQDLALLSQYSPCRRQEVFSLSHPGGHPHNWIAISGECLALLNDLTQKLIEYQEALAANGRIKSYPVPRESHPSNTSGATCLEEPSSYQPSLKTQFYTRFPQSPLVSPMNKSSTPSMRSLLSLPFTPDLSSPFESPAVNRLNDFGSPYYGSVQSSHLVKRRPKLWSSSSGSTEYVANTSQFAGQAAKVDSRSPEVTKHSPISEWILQRQEQVKTFVLKRGLVMYLFNKLPEASSQALFANSQAHIWSLEAISHLVVASFTEDRYGVVQTTLSSILCAMLSLQEAVDKHFKLPHASSKPTRSPGTLIDSSYKTLRFALRATLKTAIYRITTTFGDHLKAVQLSSEHRKRLQQFLEYKE